MTKRKKKKSNAKKCLLLTLLIVIAGAAATGIWTYRAAYHTFDGETPVTIIIPKGSTDSSIGDTLNVCLGDFGSDVYRIWALRSGNPEKAPGIYTISRGDRAWSVAGRILAGRSSTVRVTFNNVRLMTELARRIAKTFPWSEADFLAACDSILPSAGFTPAGYPAAFWPNTYEFYASAEPAEVVSKLLDERNRFWNDERRAKARRLGLSPAEVATVASIVEEESNKADERPVIARLYLNRLRKGMRLQADPTVKYALGDFTLRRIGGDQLKVQSPYNTYYVKGLPPGPIRIPDGTTIDAVLDAPDNDFLYMCAQPGATGRHNFTADYNTHLANARAYRAWLDEQGISY